MTYRPSGEIESNVNDRLTRRARGGAGMYRLVAAGVLALALGGCKQKPRPVPTAAEVRSYYDYKGRMKVDMNGNVAEITVDQPVDQLRKGGTIWAKVGPYIFLFTNDTEKLFQDYTGLAGVRVITKLTPGRHEIARAMLPRDTLSDITWKRSLHIAALARKEGTDDPARMADLIQWGEDHTRFKYNPRYVPNG